MAKKKAAAHAFTRDQLVKSRRFAAYQDILKSQLSADETYTIAQCEKIIKNFLHPVKVQDIKEDE